MHHAPADDLKAIFGHFRAHREVFPHIRQDALLRRILAGQCLYEDGVVITYQQYKKRTRVGDVEVPKGAVMLHQIVNSRQFSGAAGRVFEKFCAEVVGPSGGDLYLTVRRENTTACAFYERHGMKAVGTVAWAAGTIPGAVYFRSVAKKRTRPER
jgi:hypothetical protein